MVMEEEDLSVGRMRLWGPEGSLIQRPSRRYANWMSRFAINPKWMIYLPPTMSPPETSALEEYLEHPAEAFRYFRAGNVETVLCEEKHMGSRAVVVLCKDLDAARSRFGVDSGEEGVIYTRTGRRFFDDLLLETRSLNRCIMP